MFGLFTKHILIYYKQLGFKQGGSCINQHFSTTHGIYKSFGDGLQVCVVFSVISKAFVKSWHKDLLYKLKQSDVSDNLLDTITVL